MQLLFFLLCLLDLEAGCQGTLWCAILDVWIFNIDMVCYIVHLYM